MESIQRALQNSAQPPDRAAAAVVACAQESIDGTFAAHEASQMRATSVQRGKLMVRVTHSALAARLQQQNQALLEKINTLVNRRYPGARSPITQIISRVDQLLDGDRE